MQTASLTLTPCTLDHANALIEGPQSFERAFHLRVMPGYLEFPEALIFFRDQLRDHPEQSRWWTYLVIHRADSALIGMAGYKGPPDDQGVVEIGYGIANDYRGRGYATEAARALIGDAFTDPQVSAVIAHTMPEENPSTSVLSKVGMVRDGEMIDPEDGLVWRWKVERG